ncbi:hypothetical protein [Pseudomonas sp. B14-6]|uniref:hypothetical protein n=1 Tax=Pseudomonas sp. B14-6 TaxID=2738843 RepID=UPI002113D605|nr:hypothetical protein [Pseudomonas sp. B14-6]
MGKNEVLPATFFAEREFVCWRGREHDELYSCKVSRQGDHYVGLILDIMPIRLSDAIAEDIASCLYDAVLVTVGNLAGFVPTPTVRDSKLERTFRKRVSGEWSYSADGRFDGHETKDQVYVVELAVDKSDKTEAVGSIQLKAVG